MTIALETRDEGEEVAFFDGIAELLPRAAAGELMSEEYKQKTSRTGSRGRRSATSSATAAATICSGVSRMPW